MTPTNDPGAQTVARATAHLERYSVRMLHLFSFVPDDKLTWTPSPTAKSALRIVAHCVFTSRFLTDVITGRMPTPMPSPSEFLQGLSEAEETITTREQAIAELTANTGALRTAIETVKASTLDSTPRSPFGPLPMTFWIDHGGDQMAGHAGQLEYLQTLWGDLDNHFG